jgi:molybdopterin-biosynthesis enzyme MoeA-like protein
VTLKGIAEAFGLKLSRDPEMEQRLRAYFGEHLTAAHLKLAEVPEGDLPHDSHLGHTIIGASNDLLQCLPTPALRPALAHRSGFVMDHCCRRVRAD